MNSVAILIADSLTPGTLAPDSITLIEATRELDLLTSAFAEHDIQISTVRWRELSSLAGQYDAALPLLVWDYFEGNEAEFLNQYSLADHETTLLNPLEMIRWNANKRYLDELQKLGAPVIPTQIVERVTEADCEACFQRFETDKLVIKPLVGGGSWRQVLFEKLKPFPDADAMPPGEAMIQPLETNVVDEGEYSMLFFDGEFSHALLKRAAKGDYRVQSHYGGTEETYVPTETEMAAAKQILNSLNTVFQHLPARQRIPLYARVDMIRGDDGNLKLIELELIEPFLYLNHAEEINGRNQGAQLMAKRLSHRLTEQAQAR